MPDFKVDLQQTMEESFLTYAGFVAQHRALPAVEDGLKLGARQLLYAQNCKKLTHANPFKKAQKSVAEGMSQSYVHGDASAWGTLIRMAKPYAMRYPLEETQGSSGPPTNPNSHSAPRYVEMRASALSDELFRTLDKETVEVWKDNYDNTDKIPATFPSIGFYNIVNGASGIGVSLATSIPQFNLKEVNDAIIKLIRNPDASFEELYCSIDFATGGTIINQSEVKESLRLGSGKSAKVRATISYDVKKHMLIVTEVPYGVYTDTICQQLEQLINDNPDCGIESFLDATNDNPRIEIKLTKKANPERVKDMLYGSTSLQSYYGINMVMLLNGKVPKVFGWKDALSAHIAHITKMKKNEFLYDLKKAEARKHILDGLIIALEHIDEIIKLIKESDSAADAKEKLITIYHLSEIQAKAILEIKLQRLVNLERVKVLKELESLIKTIGEIQIILQSAELLNDKIIDDIEAITKEFADARRTLNIDLQIDTNTDAPIEEKKVVVMISNNGLIYCQDIESFNKQARGGKGSPIKLGDNDFIIETLYAANTEQLLLLSSLGKSYTLALGNVPVGQEIYLTQFFEMTPNERIVKIISYSDMTKYSDVVILTKNGLIKRSDIKEYQSRNKKGLVGIKLKETDGVAAVLVATEKDDVLLATKNGYGLRYPIGDISQTGRATMGVKAIDLRNEDEIIGAVILSKDNNIDGIASITGTGKAKHSSVNDFVTGIRTQKGHIIHKLDDGDSLMCICGIYNKSDLIVVSSSNIIKFSYDELQKSKLNTLGTIAIKLKGGSHILYMTQII